MTGLCTHACLGDPWSTTRTCSNTFQQHCMSAVGMRFWLSSKNCSRCYPHCGAHFSLFPTVQAWTRWLIPPRHTVLTSGHWSKSSSSTSFSIKQDKKEASSGMIFFITKRPKMSVTTKADKIIFLLRVKFFSRMKKNWFFKSKD